MCFNGVLWFNNLQCTVLNKVLENQRPRVLLEERNKCGFVTFSQCPEGSWSKCICGSQGRADYENEIILKACERQGYFFFLQRRSVFKLMSPRLAYIACLPSMCCIICFCSQTVHEFDLLTVNMETWSQQHWAWPAKNKTVQFHLLNLRV